MFKNILRFLMMNRIKQKMQHKYHLYWNVLFFPFSVFYKIFKIKLENKYKDCWIFMPPMAIGDLVMFCSCIKQFKEKNPGKIAVIVRNKKYYELLKCFSDIDEILIINEFIYYFGFFEYHKEFIPKIKKGVIHVVGIELLADYSYKTGIKFKLLCDVYKYSLNLNSFKKSSLSYSKSDIYAVNDIWNKMNLNRKTVFIAPDSISLCNLLSKNFWLSLADKLTEKGYEIIFNGYKNNKYKAVFLPLSQVPIFVKKCCRSIFYRSGLADLVAMDNNNLIVIYPQKMCHKDLGYAYNNEFEFNKKLSLDDNLLEIHSINNIWGKGIANELVFNCSEQELTNTILNLFREN